MSVWIGVTMLCSGFAGAAVAQDSAVEAARQALRSTRQPWYDAEDDSVRTITPAADRELERADWQARKRQPWNWNWSGWGSWSWLGELIKYLAWAIMIALTGFLLYALVRAYLNANPVRPLSPIDPRHEFEALTDEERIENLPVSLHGKQGDFLSMAASYYQAGRFGDAIVYLFSYRLLQLDRAGCIRLTKGKTNRQYLGELRQDARLREIVAQTMIPFEDFFFGHHELSREQFERCWHRNDQFLQLLQGVGAS